MNAAGKSIWRLVWFSFTWGISMIFLMAGVAAMVVGFAKAVPKESASVFLVGVLPAMTTEMLLAGLFVFQVCLFNLVSNSFLTNPLKSLAMYAFALLYGFAGAALVMRGLRSHFESPAILDGAENVFGFVSVGAFLCLLLLHRVRLPRRGSRFDRRQLQAE